MMRMLKRHAAAAVVCLVFFILGTVFLCVGLGVRTAGRATDMPDAFLMIFPLVFCGMGALFLLVTAGTLTAVISGERRRESVRARGKLVQATVTAVLQNTSVSVNNRHPYVVECRYEPGDGQTYLLKSGDIWGLAPQLAPGDAVPVYWDDYDKKHYTVDLTGLPDTDAVDLR